MVGGIADGPTERPYTEPEVRFLESIEPSFVDDYCAGAPPHCQGEPFSYLGRAASCSTLPEEPGSEGALVTSSPPLVALRSSLQSTLQGWRIVLRIRG